MINTVIIFLESNMTSPTKIAVAICSALLLTACSQGKAVSNLQQDFDKHKYSTMC